jgi:hypothetical protein
LSVKGTQKRYDLGARLGGLGGAKDEEMKEEEQKP